MLKWVKDPGDPNQIEDELILCSLARITSAIRATKTMIKETTIAAGDNIAE